jgi:outer membrane protein
VRRCSLSPNAIAHVAALVTSLLATVERSAAAIPPATPATPAPAALPAGPEEPLAFASLSFAQAEQDGLHNSPEVQAAQAIVDQSAAALAAARAAYGPALVGGYAMAPQGSSTGTIASHITSVGLQTTVGDLLAYSPLVAAANANLRSAQATAAVVVRTEQVKVAGLYFDALKARAIRQARESDFALAKQQRDAAQIRFQAGDAPRLDVVRAQVAVARATAAVETARAADANATEALRVETGVPATLAETTTGPFPTIPAAAGGPETAVAAALVSRPELRAAAQTTAAAEAATRAARWALFPALTVGAGYNHGIDSGFSVGGPTITMSLSLPLSGVASARAAQQAGIVRESAAKRVAVQRQIELEVSAAARNLAAAHRATLAASEARRQASDELQASELGYRSGAVSSLELSIARETYTQALVDELSARYDEAKASATLAVEVGP